VAHVLPLSNGGAIRWMACAGACCLVLNGSDDAVDWEKCYLLMDLYLLLLPSAGCVSLKKEQHIVKRLSLLLFVKSCFFVQPFISSHCVLEVIFVEPACIQCCYCLQSFSWKKILHCCLPLCDGGAFFWWPCTCFATVCRLHFFPKN